MATVGQSTELIPATLFDLPPAGAVHHKDPETSRMAAQDPQSRIRWESQRHRLLRSFARYGDLTDEEAGRLAHVEGYNDKRRCSDLRRWGLIEPTTLTRPTATGRQSMVCTLTVAGRSVLEQIRETDEQPNRWQ